MNNIVLNTIYRNNNINKNNKCLVEKTENCVNTIECIVIDDESDNDEPPHKMGRMSEDGSGQVRSLAAPLSAEIKCEVKNDIKCENESDIKTDTKSKLTNGYINNEEISVKQLINLCLEKRFQIQYNAIKCETNLFESIEKLKLETFERNKQLLQLKDLKKSNKETQFNTCFNKNALINSEENSLKVETETGSVVNIGTDL